MWRAVLAASGAALLGALTIGAGAAGGAGAAVTTLAGAPACYGAAARDPERPCRNPDLRLAVTPAPADPVSAPRQPCETTWEVCAVGPLDGTASAQVALIGDSHAAMIRPAFRIIGEQRGIQVSNIWRPGCPFSTLPPDLGRRRSQDCVTWSRRIVDWLKGRPKISTVVLAAHQLARVAPQPGLSPFDAKVSGYEAAIRSLPASVKRVIVVRDPPNNPREISSCVRREYERGQSAATRCRSRRADVLQPDAQVEAARRVRSRAVDVIDLTPFMCGPAQCVPVVGGVLVHKDGDHLTAEFATTLAPYLDRAIRRMRPAVPGFR